MLRVMRGRRVKLIQRYDTRRPRACPRGHDLNRSTRKSHLTQVKSLFSPIPTSSPHPQTPSPYPSLYPISPLSCWVRNSIWFYFSFSQPVCSSAEPKFQAGTPLIHRCILRPMILHAYPNTYSSGYGYIRK